MSFHFKSDKKKMKQEWMKEIVNEKTALKLTRVLIVEFCWKFYSVQFLKSHSTKFHEEPCVIII